MNVEEDFFLPQPDLAGVPLSAVMQALADPVRLQIIRALDQAGESTCTALDVPVKVSTVSHHLGKLREAGVVSTRLAGNTRPSRLRYDDLDARFPGLLTSILRAEPPLG
ncbi:ArsR/SmtB family transcription factor [Kribbella sp. NPDC051586]|uniref:ArsR/SmtB family transcription factor n=1 Tax=Kribbella sp. NPDC051586 TaxID=3364118 RepID=UPI00379F273E